MLNDRDEKYEGHDEGEYHFSDDEVNYETENEAPPAEEAEAQESPEMPLEKPRKKLLNPKRMVLLGVIAVVLIYVVYKMFSPSPDAMQIQPVDTQSPPINKMPTSLNNSPVNPPTSTTPTTTISVPPEGTLGGMYTGAVPSSSTPTTAVSTEATPSVPQPQPLPTPEVLSATQQELIDNKVAAGVAKTEQLVSQMQADFAQRLNNAETQNRILQEQVQSLNARLGTIENQLNQLVQSLIRQNQSPPPASTPASNSINQSDAALVTPVPPAPSPQKVAYSVQAIIPGRAWLKSDNGETVTVAEGDVIKELGRVIKIDPYDGVVEINTGNHVVSLSYGNQG